MKTFGLRNVIGFDTKTSGEILDDNDKIVLEIKSNNSIVHEQTVFLKYTCTLKKNITERAIFTYQRQEIEVPNYVIPNKFEMYYHSQSGLMFTIANTAISNEFFKVIENNLKCTVSKIDFNFKKIIQRSYTAKGVWYTVDGNSVKTRGAFGPYVDRDTESLNAIQNDKGTYLTIEFNHTSGPKTVGLSKKSAIVIYNKFDNSEEEITLMLLVYNTFK